MIVRPQCLLIRELFDRELVLVRFRRQLSSARGTRSSLHSTDTLTDNSRGGTHPAPLPHCDLDRFVPMATRAGGGGAEAKAAPSLSARVEMAVSAGPRASADPPRRRDAAQILGPTRAHGLFYDTPRCCGLSATFGSDSMNRLPKRRAAAGIEPTSVLDDLAPEDRVVERRQLVVTPATASAGDAVHLDYDIAEDPPIPTLCGARRLVCTHVCTRCAVPPPLRATPRAPQNGGHDLKVLWRCARGPRRWTSGTAAAPRASSVAPGSGRRRPKWAGRGAAAGT